MKIYLLQSTKVSGLGINHDYNIIDLSDRKIESDPESEIQMDAAVCTNIRGYPMTEFEFLMYSRHFLAWQDLKNSDDEYALIIENVEKILYTVAEMNYFVSTFEEDWNIVFPFDGYRRSNEANNSYMLGFRWGTDAYFVNKNCLPVLLTKRKIGLPIDEQLLTFNRENIINIYYEEIKMFSYCDNSKYEKDSNTGKLAQILKTNVWNFQDRHTVRTLLKNLCDILHLNDIEYFISEGTLLGCIRHDKIMDWDDDVDISVNRSDVNKIVEIINKSTRYSITKRYWGKGKHPYYKIWNKESENIGIYDYGFPFIDVWIYDVTENNLVYNHGRSFPKNIVFPTKKTEFEHCQVRIPKKASAYLDLKYYGWREKITIYRWSHKSEKAILPPLSAKITVDKNGLFINDIS